MNRLSADNVQDSTLRARLAEYKHLSESMCDLHAGRRHLLLIAGIITAAMLTAGFQFKRPEIFLVASFLLNLFWYKDMRMRETIIKTRAYIEAKIEKHVNGLQWETLHSKEQSSRYRLRFSSIGMTVIRVYSPLIILNLIIGYLGPSSGKLPISECWYAIAWAVVTGFYLLTLLFAVKREKLKADWVKKWEGVKVQNTEKGQTTKTP